MAKVRVEKRFEIVQLVNKFSDKNFSHDLGTELVTAIKAQIADGISPVRGHSRFARYKDRTKYPADQKPARPVNLNLSGEMLKNLTFKIKENNKIDVGILTGSAEVKARAQAHNTGTEHMAMRRFIPQTGEEFSVRIMRRIAELYGKRLQKLIKLSNK